METRRLSVIITDDDQRRIHKSIPWGLMSRMMRMLLLQTLDLVEQHGDIVLGALLSGKLTALDLLKQGGSDSGLVGPKTEPLSDE